MALRKDTRRRWSPTRQFVALWLVLGLMFAPVAEAERTRLKPGWNLFKPQHDVEIGRRLAADAERQLPMLNDPQVDNYINRLGQRLAAKAPGERFPYRFRVVNDHGINAFALPGGPIFIHRGIIEAADSEAQLSGVIAHEIGHVALRHGTNQASKAQAAQLPLALLGGILGSGSIVGLVTQLGASFTASSILLKFSRDAERQADVLGAQILYDNNYDPRAMVQFFEKIEAEGKSGGPPEWFSSHPKPENRAERVQEEIERLGGPPANYRRDSREFRAIKQRVLAMPRAPKPGQPPRGDARTGRPAPPSARFRVLNHVALSIQYPDNWQVYGEGSAASLVPDGGFVQDRNGNTALAYGAILNIFEPHTDRYGKITVEEATDQLIEELRQSNPRMRLLRQQERIRVGGVRGLSTMLVNDSPVGGQEIDWLVTFQRPEGLVYFVGVVPQRDWDQYEAAFEAMVDSIRFPR